MSGIQNLQMLWGHKRKTDAPSLRPFTQDARASASESQMDIIFTKFQPLLQWIGIHHSDFLWNDGNYLLQCPHYAMIDTHTFAPQSKTIPYRLPTRIQTSTLRLV